MDKFIPPDLAIDALLEFGEKDAEVDCDRQLMLQSSGMMVVDHFSFNRGFEYGVQWALDNLEWLERYKNFSHSVSHSKEKAS